MDISWASVAPGEDDLRTVLSAPSMEMTVALGEAAEDDIALFLRLLLFICQIIMSAALLLRGCDKTLNNLALPLINLGRSV